jgi:hypothetical protein
MKRYITHARGLELRNNIRKAQAAIADLSMSPNRVQWWKARASYAERSLDLGYEIISE